MIGPVVSPVTILLTLGLLGPKFALFRLIFSFVISLGLAYLTILLFKKEERVLEYPEQKIYLKEKNLNGFGRNLRRKGLRILGFLQGRLCFLSWFILSIGAGLLYDLIN